MRVSRCRQARHPGNRGLRLPWLCAEWKESPPPPYQGSLANLTPFPASGQQAHPSLKGAKYLIALTDVGLFIQRRLRGSSKEKEAEVSKNINNTNSQTKSKLGALLTTTATLQEDKEMGESVRSHRHMQRERTPASGPSFSSQPGSRG